MGVPISGYSHAKLQNSSFYRICQRGNVAVGRKPLASAFWGAGQPLKMRAPLRGLVQIITEVGFVSFAFQIWKTLSFRAHLVRARPLPFLTFSLGKAESS